MKPLLHQTIEMRDLKAEILEFSTRVSELTTSSVMANPPSTSPRPTANTLVESSEEKSIQALKKEVVKLCKQVSVMSVKPKYSPVTVLHHDDTKSQQVQQKPFAPRDSSDFFCYRCGEDGHFATKCAAPENDHKVVQKLLQAQRKQRTNRKADQDTRAKVMKEKFGKDAD